MSQWQLLTTNHRLLPPGDVQQPYRHALRADQACTPQVEPLPQQKHKTEVGWGPSALSLNLTHAFVVDNEELVHVPGHSHDGPGHAEDVALHAT